MWSDRHCFAVAVALYGISTLYSFFLWRREFRKDNFVNYAILLLGFLFHCAAMGLRGFSYRTCPVNNLFEASMFIGWAMMLAYLGMGALPRFRYLGVFVSPLLFCLGVFALMPPLDGPRTSLQIGYFSLHASLTFLAYGSYGLGAASSLMFLTQEHDLKFHQFRAVFSRLPSIHRLEIMIKRFSWTGLVLLTGGMIIGMVWLKSAKGVWYQPDPKIHWSLLVWLYYAILLVGQQKFGWRGRKFAWGALGGFVFIVLTFWGFNLFSPLHRL